MKTTFTIEEVMAILEDVLSTTASARCMDDDEDREETLAEVFHVLNNGGSK